MSIKEALSLRRFVIRWITKVVASGNHWKTVDYRNRLLAEVDELLPDDIGKYDPYSMLSFDNWDDGMGDFFRDWEYDTRFSYSNKFQRDIVCSFRIAVDLQIQQSGGVVGYTAGDLRKFYDNIPIGKKGFNKEILTAPDETPVWL